jgi:hypothetical protein
MRTDNDKTSKTQTTEKQDNTNDNHEQNNISDYIMSTSEVRIHDDEVQMSHTHSVNDPEGEVDEDDMESDDEIDLSENNETVVESRTNLNSENID